MTHQDSLREDALQIWKAGVAAVDSSRLVADQIECTGNTLTICGHVWSSEPGSRICVVGAGKAGAGMARAVESALSPDLLKITTGWVNVPEDCVHELQKIHLHAGRPAGVNEPTQAGVEGAQQILKKVRALNEKDLCLVLISGGGSALLPAPREGITLEEKLQVTRSLMRGGATIDELNCVRRALSSIKGGGLLRACQAGVLMTLIISDVIGSPLETIASGPTIDVAPDPGQALAVLSKIESRSGFGFPPSVVATLKEMAQTHQDPDATTVSSPSGLETYTCVIGDNATAVSAACRAASKLGFEIHRAESDQAGIAKEIGQNLAEECLQLKQQGPTDKPLCLVTGGEPTVHVVKTDLPQQGGRNQELILAATQRLWDEDASGIAILSGGTDGEDGPTDAAGAMIDQSLIDRAKSQLLLPEEYLETNNSYPFFQSIGGLLKTGPTHTNVMDLRVALIANINGDQSECNRRVD